jgi:hypothetical protein
MAIRGYVQPKTVLGNIHYLNPNVETLIADKNLTPIDSSLQCLNPGNDVYKITLPEEIYSDGMIINVINASTTNGKLEIYDFTNNIKIDTIDPQSEKQFICLVNEWKTYTAFNIGFYGFPNEVEDYDFDDSMTSSEINTSIGNISRYIHPNKIVNIKFASGTYNNINLFFNHFYGNGTLNITCEDITCHPKIISPTGYGFEISNIKNLTINIIGLILEQHDNCILFKDNQNCILNINNCRLINTQSSAINTGVNCDTDVLNNIFVHNNINIFQSQFGNFEYCVSLNGDFSCYMQKNIVALTESSSPVPMPSNHSFYLDNGSKIVLDTMTHNNLGNGTIVKGVAYI